MMKEDIDNIKFIDEDNNEYIVATKSNYNNNEYVLMTNLNNERDYFFAKINYLDYGVELDIIKDEKLIKNIIDCVGA